MNLISLWLVLKCIEVNVKDSTQPSVTLHSNKENSSHFRCTLYSLLLLRDTEAKKGQQKQKCQFLPSQKKKKKGFT